MIKRGFLLASLLVIAALAIQTLSVASPVGNENTSSVLNASTTLEPIDSGALNVSVDVSDSIRLFRTESSGNELSTATENQTELNAMFIRLFEIDDKLIEEDIFVNQSANQTINGTATPHYGLSGRLVFNNVNIVNHARDIGVYLYVVTD